MEIQLPAEQDYTPALVPAVGPGYDGCLFLQLIYAATAFYYYFDLRFTGTHHWVTQI